MAAHELQAISTLLISDRLFRTNDVAKVRMPVNGLPASLFSDPDNQSETVSGFCCMTEPFGSSTEVVIQTMRDEESEPPNLMQSLQRQYLVQCLCVSVCHWRRLL